MRLIWVPCACVLSLGCGSSDDDSSGSGGGGNAGPWRVEAPLPEAAAHLVGAELGGKIWVVGGVAGDVSKKVWSYDPAANAWSPGPELPEPRQLPALTGSGGELYAVGGFSQVNLTATDSTFVLPAGASAWTKKSSLLLNRASGFACDLGGKVWVVGGAGDSKLLGDTVVFDPATNAWAVKAAIPNPRQRFAGFVLSGSIHAVGGATESGADSATHDVYDPTGDAWTSGAALPKARAGVGAAVLGDRAYLAGGDDAGSVDVYDGAAWSSAPPLGTPRIGAAVVAAAGRVYVIGGELPGGGGPSAVVESYAP